jgi:hypothetical protein
MVVPGVNEQQDHSAVEVGDAPHLFDPIEFSVGGLYKGAVVDSKQDCCLL